MRKRIYGYGAEAIPALISSGKIYKYRQDKSAESKRACAKWEVLRERVCGGGEASRAAVLLSEPLWAYVAV